MCTELWLNLSRKSVVGIIDRPDIISISMNQNKENPELHVDFCCLYFR